MNKTQIKAINTLSKECNEIARDHGWWPDEGRNFGELLALVHSEVSECLEEFRKYGDPEHGAVVEEIADVFIRCFDMAGQLNWNLGGAIAEKIEKNRKRPHRHGGKHC